jgi:thiosulfate dehydrogenase
VKAFIAGLIVGAGLLVVAVWFYFISGRAPAAVEDRPIPFEKKLANAALDAHSEREMPKSVPIAADEATFLAGAQVYDLHCGICHGFPETGQGPMPQGMFPKPPQLFKGKGVSDDPPGETYWKVDNGIRLTGMPEFKHILNSTEIWQVSLVLANSDKISDAVRQQLKPPAAPQASPPPGGPTLPGKLAGARRRPSTPPPIR